MNKQDIIRDTITATEFIETRDLSVLSDRFTSGGVTKNDIYNVYKEHKDKRNKHLFDELCSGLDIRKHIDGEWVTFDCGDYITDAFDEGKSLMHMMKYLSLPRKVIEMYLDYMGYQTASNTSGEVAKLLDKLVEIRTKSRELYYQFTLKSEYADLIAQENALKSDVTKILGTTANRKKLKHNGVTISPTHTYNKKTITVNRIIDELGRDKAKELFDIDKEQTWKQVITTGKIDMDIRDKIK